MLVQALTRIHRLKPNSYITQCPVLPYSGNRMFSVFTSTKLLQGKSFFMTFYGFVQSWEIPVSPLQTPPHYLNRIRFVFRLEMTLFLFKRLRLLTGTLWFSLTIASPSLLGLPSAPLNIRRGWVWDRCVFGGVSKHSREFPLLLRWSSGQEVEPGPQEL